MKLALPQFQFRFMKAAGNVIFPGNFHPVGTQRAAEAMIERCLADGSPARSEGGPWLVVGGSGGFGSAARVALACDRGVDTLNLSFDAPPTPESGNKIRKIGSPGFHRNLAIERRLRSLGLTASSVNGDAFDPEVRARVIDELRRVFGGRKLGGIVWALAAPRGLDPRTGEAVKSVLKPLRGPAKIRTFTGAEGDADPTVDELALEPGTPAEAIRTVYVMGGDVVQAWVDALREADLLDEGFTLLTISYRGGPLNADIYHEGLIGLAKAHLEFTTAALDKVLAAHCKGRALAVEGPAVVTEASGGIPGVPFYMALLLDVLGDRFEDPLDSMRRMFAEKVPAEGPPALDAEGLVRMDDRELTEEVQGELARRYEALQPGATFDRALYDRFMEQYAQTRGFDIDGVDYEAEFDTDEICREAD